MPRDEIHELPEDSLERKVRLALRHAGQGSTAGLRALTEGQTLVTDAENHEIYRRLLSALSDACVDLAREVDRLKARMPED